MHCSGEKSNILDRNLGLDLLEKLTSFERVFIAMVIAGSSRAIHEMFATVVWW
jgi:hypothetical protein